MLTLQRSPGIVCADMLDQVNFEEDPTLADFGPRYLATSRFLLQRDRMNQEIGSGFLQGECAHGLISKNRPSLRACRQRSTRTPPCRSRQPDDLRRIRGRSGGIRRGG